MSVLCLFLVACSSPQNIEDSTQTPPLHTDTLDDTVSDAISVESEPQTISPLISFDEGPYDGRGYDKWGYDG
jgi:hypothetical protein